MTHLSMMMKTNDSFANVSTPDNPSSRAAKLEEEGLRMEVIQN